MQQGLQLLIARLQASYSLLKLILTSHQRRQAFGAGAFLLKLSLHILYQGGEIVRFGSVDIGCAVSTDRGLLAPVIRDLGNARIHDIADKTRDIVDRTRRNKLKPDDFGAQLEKLYMDNWDQILAKSGLTKDNLDHPEQQPNK